MKLPVCIKGEGAPLLMIHGIISDASFFSNITSELSDEYKIITYDRRGYGSYDGDPISDYSIGIQADDAMEIIKEYANEGCFVIGNSAGGLVAIELCIRYPELVKGVLLLEPSLPYDEASKEKLVEWNAELNGYKAEKRIKKALAAFTHMTGSDNQRTSDMDLQSMKRTFKNLENFMYGELDEVQNYTPSLESVRKIIQPVKVLISSQGCDSIYAQAALQSAKVIGWETVAIPGFHNAIKDRPESSAVIIRQLLEEMNCGK